MNIKKLVGAGVVAGLIGASSTFLGLQVYTQLDNVLGQSNNGISTVNIPSSQTPLITASPTPKPTPHPYSTRLDQLFGNLPEYNTGLNYYYSRISELEQELLRGYTDPNIKEELAWDHLMVHTNAFVRGVYVLGWAPEAYTTVDLDTMLDKIRDDYHANTVVFLTTVENEGTQFFKTGPADNSLQYAVGKAREHGLVPGIRIQIDPTAAESARLGTNWRASIGEYFGEAEWAEWLRNLKNTGMDYVNFAHANNVPLLVMFDEMRVAQQRPEFAGLLKELEHSYDGVMTYQPNFDDTQDFGLFVNGTNSYSPARNQLAARRGDTTPFDQASAIRQFTGAEFEQSTGSFIPSPFQQTLSTIFTGKQYSLLTETGSNNSNSAYPFGCLFPGGLVETIPSFTDEQMNYYRTTATVFSKLANEGRVHGAIFWGVMGQPEQQLYCASDFRITPESGAVLKQFFDDPFHFGVEYWDIVAESGILP
ncbi:MAG: hypothetical protein AABX51_00505 [Nanoarchaeota archaeon]